MLQNVKMFVENSVKFLERTCFSILPCKHNVVLRNSVLQYLFAILLLIMLLNQQCPFIYKKQLIHTSTLLYPDTADKHKSTDTLHLIII